VTSIPPYPTPPVRSPEPRRGGHLFYILGVVGLPGGTVEPTTTVKLQVDLVDRLRVFKLQEQARILRELSYSQVVDMLLGAEEILRNTVATEYTDLSFPDLINHIVELLAKEK